MKKQGFTLIEVMVAMMIMIIVIMAAVNAEAMNLNSAADTRHKLEAIALAQQGINAAIKNRAQSLPVGKTQAIYSFDQTNGNFLPQGDNYYERVGLNFPIDDSGSSQRDYSRQIEIKTIPTP